MDNIWSVFFLSLLVTILLESIFVFIIGIRDKRNLILITLVNVLTNPTAVLLYYLLYNFTFFSNYIITITIELTVVLVEYIYVRKYSENIKNPLWISLGMNTFSYLVGKGINTIINKAGVF